MYEGKMTSELGKLIELYTECSSARAKEWRKRLAIEDVYIHPEVLPSKGYSCH